MARPRRRMIDPGIWSNEQFGTVPPIARLLYVGTISLSDDYGRLKGDPRYLKGQLFCYDDDITVGLIEEMLVELEEVDLILQYEVDGKPYIAHLNWLSYQKIPPSKRQPSNIPSPPTAEKKLPAGSKKAAARQKKVCTRAEKKVSLIEVKKRKEKIREVVRVVYLVLVLRARAKRPMTKTTTGTAHPLQLPDSELQPPLPDFLEAELFGHYVAGESAVPPDSILGRRG